MYQQHIREFLNFFLFCIISPLIYIVFLPILFCFIFLNEIIRIIVQQYLNYKYGGKLQLCSNGEDSIWEFRTKGNTRMVIVPNVARENQLDDMNSITLQFKKYLFDTTDDYEKLKNIITVHKPTGYVCCKRKLDFNIRDHVRSLSKNKIYHESEVMELFSELCQDMDESKPQWELILIPKYQGITY